MLSEELQKALDAAFVSALMEDHDLLTVEHLLLALLSGPNVWVALSAAGAASETLVPDLPDYAPQAVHGISGGPAGLRPSERLGSESRASSSCFTVGRS